MTLQQLKSKFQTELDQLYPANEIKSFFSLLASHKLGLTTIDLALQPNLILEQHDLDFFLNAFAKLKQEKPIQYILGETEFYGLPFKVNKNVLIPRPETEELVDWILKESKVESQKSKVEVLDIGTGSGCIAISLAKNLSNATVNALDVSKEALETSKQNAELNDVNINFIEADILDPNVMLGLPKYQKFNIIVSNPPYVRNLEKAEIQNNVLENEPHLALFVENDNALLFYDTIADFAKTNLSKNGTLYFEINQYLSTKTVNLLKTKGFKNIELKKDLFGNYRMLKATF